MKNSYLKRSILSLGLLFLASCTLHPKYARPQVETPTTWRLTDEEMPSYSNLCWWKQFHDPVLDGLIDEALRNNQDVKVVIYRVEAFAAKLGIAQSQLYPQFSGNVDAGRGKQSTNLAPLIPGAAAITDVFSLVLNASYLVDIWGQVRSATEVAKAQLLSQVEVRRGVVLTLVSSLASSYITLRQFDKQLDIAYQTLDSRNESYRIATIRYDLGLTSLMQVQQALSEVEAAKVQVDQLKINIALQEDLISVLLGVPSETILRGSILDDIVLPPEVPSCLPSELLNQRPDILAAEQNLIAANAQIGVAKSEYFPQFSLTGAYGAQSTQLSNLLTQPSNVWQYGLSILQEIFTGGRITSNVKLAEAQKIELLHQYQSTILNAFKEVNDALISHQISLDLVNVLCERVQTLKEYFRLAGLRYQEGQTDYLTYLDAERQLFRTELDYAKAQGQSFTTLIDIYKALGGGWVTEADEYAKETEKLEARTK